jgi:hypothetical protein
MLGTGFWLVVLLIVAGALWRWKIVARQREQARAQREAEFLLLAATAKAASQNAVSKETPAKVAAPALPPASAKPAPALDPHPRTTEARPPESKQAYLNRVERLSYMLVKAAHPDIEVFAHASLRRIVASPAQAGHLRCTLLVCQATGLLPIIAIDLANPQEPESQVLLKQTLLKASGIPYLRWNPATLPSLEKVRALMTQLLGQKTQDRAG